MLAEIEHPRILEIGGGLGRTAFYANELGLCDYTLIDIPLAMVSQGYFLGCGLGPEAIAFDGEGGAAAGRLRLLPPDTFLDANEQYDIVLNADSLTEFDLAVASRYVDKIRDCAGAFLSINHEYNKFRVRDLLQPELRRGRYQRVPYWMRRGYVEELVYF